MGNLLADQNKLHKAEVVIGFVGLSFMLLLMSAFAYLHYFDRLPPLEYLSYKVSNLYGVETTNFHAGETILLTRSFCVRDRQVIDMDRRFISPDQMISFAAENSTIILPPIGCHTTTRPIIIPSELPTGKWRYTVAASYQNNVLHKGTVDLPVVEIDVIGNQKTVVIQGPPGPAGPPGKPGKSAAIILPIPLPITGQPGPKGERGRKAKRAIPARVRRSFSRRHTDMRTRTIRICSELVSISEPMDAGKFVELIFKYPPCEHTEVVGGGEKRWRVPAGDAGLWKIGDCFYEIQRLS